MRLIEQDIQLVSGTKEDPQITEISDEFDILKNLSEVNLYDQPMPSELNFRIERDKQTVGVISLKSIRWFNRKAEISILVKAEFQGKGIAKKALNTLLNYAFNAMNFHRIEAEIFAYNKVGIALVEKLGFIREGILREARYLDGQYHDIIRYGLLKEEYGTKQE